MSSKLEQGIRPKPIWRPLTSADMPNLITISNEIHPNLPESPSVFLERISLFPSGCLALSLPIQNTSPQYSGEEEQQPPPLLGYAISHPILHRRPPPLDALLGQLDPSANQYYIHDLALLPEVRGTGLAKEGVEMMLENAREMGYETTGLVSVYGTREFWGRFGFEELGEVKAEEGEGDLFRGKPKEALGERDAYEVLRKQVKDALTEGEDEVLREKLKEYGDDAVFLERKNGV